MDPYLCCFDGAKIRFLDELSKSISKFLQTQGFAGAPIKSSGVIDEAISQQGKTIVVNVEHALALIKVSKWRNATSLSAVNACR